MVCTRLQGIFNAQWRTKCAVINWKCVVTKGCLCSDKTIYQCMKCIYHCIKALGLYSLQRRRLRGDLIETYKILTGKDQLFQKATTTELRGHSLKLYKKSSRLELRKHSFSQRIVDHWNKLPDDIVSAATISTFKRRLDTWMDRYGH